jgi:hypothetical protein
MSGGGAVSSCSPGWIASTDSSTYPDPSSAPISSLLATSGTVVNPCVTLPTLLFAWSSATVLLAVAASTQQTHPAATQDSTRLPSTSTVQAPHAPWSQPFFVPVSPSRSRSASSSVTRASTCSRSDLPLIRMVTAITGIVPW